MIHRELAKCCLHEKKIDVQEKGGRVLSTGTCVSPVLIVTDSAVIMTCVGFKLFMVSINQHGLEVARRCYSGEEVEKAL